MFLYAYNAHIKHWYNRKSEARHGAAPPQVPTRQGGVGGGLWAINLLDPSNTGGGFINLYGSVKGGARGGGPMTLSFTSRMG